MVKDEMVKQGKSRGTGRPGIDKKKKNNGSHSKEKLSFLF